MLSYLPIYWTKFWWEIRFNGFAIGHAADRFDANVGFGPNNTIPGKWTLWDPMGPQPQDPRQSTW